MKLAQKFVVNYYRAKLNLMAVISKKAAAKMALNLFCTPLRRHRKKAPPVFTTGEPLQFRHESHIIHGYRWNHPSPKKALVVHGFESSCKNFDRYISSLIKKGYEVIAFDAPAHGNSSGRQINLPLYLSTVQYIYKQYGPIESFVTHSFGGLVIAHFLETITHDESVRAVFIAPATETVTTIDAFFKFLQLDDGVRKEFDQQIFTRSGYWPAHFSIRRAMHNVQAQILWFHDEDDELTPLEDALKVEADRHPNISFRITKGLGHRKIYRDNKVIKEALEFL